MHGHDGQYHPHPHPVSVVGRCVDRVTGERKYPGRPPSRRGECEGVPVEQGSQKRCAGLGSCLVARWVRELQRAARSVLTTGSFRQWPADVR